MVIRELLEIGRKKLNNLKYVDPLKESVYILAELLEKDKTFIYTNLDKGVSNEEEVKYLSYIDDRAGGKPVSYIFNKKEFMGIDFYIEKGVLIPRPETEELVEYILAYIGENFKNKEVDLLDIGVGSGAISLSIARECKNARVLGIDISDRPLRVANKNLKSLGLKNVTFKKSDLFSNIGDEKFSIIVSNPPYIRSSVIKDLQRDVRDFEPRLALDGGRDGLLFYKKIIAACKDYLLDKGMVIFEIGYDQGEDVRDIFIGEGFRDVEIIKDLQGLDRIVLAFKN